MVQRARDDLFAGPRIAQDQHRSVARGRALGDGKTRESLVYVELENRANTASGEIGLLFDTDALRCELTDTNGKAVPQAPMAGSGGRPGKKWVTLPYDSSIRLRANPYAFGRADGFLNDGSVYHDVVGARDAGETAIAFYARRYRHTDEAGWRSEFDAGRVRRAGAAVGV